MTLCDKPGCGSGARWEVFGKEGFIYACDGCLVELRKHKNYRGFGMILEEDGEVGPLLEWIDDPYAEPVRMSVEEFREFAKNPTDESVLGLQKRLEEGRKKKKREAN